MYGYKHQFDCRHCNHSSIFWPRWCNGIGAFRNIGLGRSNCRCNKEQQKCPLHKVSPYGSLRGCTQIKGAVTYHADNRLASGVSTHTNPFFSNQGDFRITIGGGLLATCICENTTLARRLCSLVPKSTGILPRHIGDTKSRWLNYPRNGPVHHKCWGSIRRMVLYPVSTTA